MQPKRRYVPRNYLWFARLLKMSYGLFLRLVYRVASPNRELAASFRAPYVLIANHASILDPFILGLFLRDPAYWVTSDTNMRTRIKRSLLLFVGSIPKSKSIPDIETVNWIVDIIRKRRGVVGIFPEGQATWDGRTLPLLQSTAKLVKLLKVPVVAAVIKGGHLSMPRWTWARRRGRIEIEWKKLLSPEEIKALPAEAVYERMAAALAHDEEAWEAEARVPFESRRRAENLELALFMCPRCGAVGSMRSSGKDFGCAACGMALHLDRYGRFRDPTGGRPPFAGPKEWGIWQGQAFKAWIAASPAGKPIFSEGDVRLLRGRRINPLRPVARGSLALFRDRIELAPSPGEVLAFPIDQIEAIGVHVRQILDFYVGKDLYQARFPLRSISARKWMEAVEALRAD
jgi:1-acyl-sn-glycerol-3-phosphate acyltransferase